MKQRVRLKLLESRPGVPLIDPDRLAAYQTQLIQRVRHLGSRVLVLGLLPVDQSRFPGSPEHFQLVNARLRQIATAEGADFFDWGSLLPANGTRNDLFYRDSFHPNEAGAAALGKILREHVCSGGPLWPPLRMASIVGVSTEGHPYK